MTLADVEINEDIDKYQNCLDDDDKNWSAAEEANLHKFGIGTKWDGAEAHIKSGVMESKAMHLTGVHCYSILRNPTYCHAFQYYAAYENRAALIKDDDDDSTNDAAQSDIVAIALNLAYLTEEKIKAMSFTKAALTEITQASEAKKGGNDTAIN